MSDHAAANWSTVTLPGVATVGMRKLAASLRNPRSTPRALLAAIAVGPFLVAALLIASGAVWPLLVAGSNAMTAALYPSFEAVRGNPGWTAEMLRVLLGATLAAVPPSLGFGAFEKTPVGRAVAAVMFYPAWLLTMLAPAVVIHLFWDRIDPTLMGGQASAHFLLLFSAAATSIGLAFSLWARTCTAFYDPPAPTIVELR